VGWRLHTPWEKTGAVRSFHSFLWGQLTTVEDETEGLRGQGVADGSHLLNLFLHHLDLILSRFYLLLQLLYFVVKHKLEFL
jgi:hypothetical protein